MYIFFICILYFTLGYLLSLILNYYALEDINRRGRSKPSEMELLMFNGQIVCFWPIIAPLCVIMLIISRISR